MRILLINHTARPHTGGLNRMVVETCGLLQAAGHEVALAYDDGGASAVACRVFALPAVTVEDAEMREAVGRLLKEFQPEVVQLHTADHPFFRSAIARIAPTCRYVHDQSLFCSGGDRMTGAWEPCHRPHGVGCLAWHYALGCGGKNPVGNLARWRRVQAWCEMRGATSLRLQVASEFMRQGLLENGYAADRIDVVPLFAVAPVVETATEPGLLLVASRLVKGKGVTVLLEALAGLREASWRLAIAGTGPQLGELRALAARLGLAERVEFVGELPPAELDAWYSRASVVVSPVVRPEPFGLVGIEAMRRGKPVVAFAGGATEEWLVDGETGLVVRERQAGALAAALKRILEDAALRGRCAVAAREGANRFAPERFVQRLLESFEACRAGFGAR